MAQDDDNEPQTTGQPDVEESAAARPPSADAQPSIGDAESNDAFAPRRLPVVPILLVLNTGMVVFSIGLTFSLFSNRSEPSSVELRISSSEVAPDDRQARSQPARPEKADDRQRAASWRLAREAYRKEDYREALRQYVELLRLAKARNDPTDTLAEDFFGFSIAQCLERLDSIKEARQSYRNVARSRSPILQALAEYNLAVLDCREDLYMQARMRAYRAIAALGAMETPTPLETDCDFLVAGALTRYALSFYDKGDALDDIQGSTADPFAGLDQAGVWRLLDDGVASPGRDALGPRIGTARDGSAPNQLTAVCSRAPLEEVLVRFSATMKMEVEWVSVPPAARQMATTLRFSKISPLRLIEVACGGAGLLARFTGQKIVIHDPRTYRGTSQLRQLLGDESISAWRRVFLRAPADKRIPQGHLALAALYESSGDTAGAISEYQLVAHRFRGSDKAPRALLRCAGLRSDLGDFLGARKDLLDLLDAYPGFTDSQEAYLRLARAAWKVGLSEEAIRTFSKLYYLGLSSSSRASACFGAAACLYEQGNFRDAAEWLKRYIAMGQAGQNGNLYEAYYMLGKSQAAMGDLYAATLALTTATRTDPSGTRRVEISLQLVQVYAERERFAAAIDILNRLASEKLTQRQTCRWLALTSEVMRSVGMPEMASAILQSRISSVTDPRDRAGVQVELARCRAEMGDLQGARELLAGALPVLEPGPDAWDAAWRLAEICLKSGDADQAIAISRELLKTSCPAGIRRKASEILGLAYMSGRDYESAALAFSMALPKNAGDNNK